LCAALALVPAAGCRQDHRISLQEFLTMQDAADRMAAPPPITEEHIEAQADAISLIDRQFSPYRVGPQDVLAVTVTGGEQGTAVPIVQTRVNSGGQVDLPIVGTLSVMDLTLEEVEARIHDAYVPAYVRDAVVHVELTSVDSTDVLVVGAVSSPGLVPLRRTDRNLLHALVSAGGVSMIASGHVTLRRLRHPVGSSTLDLTTVEGLRTALTLDPLESGDVITVNVAEPNVVFVGGLVNSPRPQSYPPGVRMNVLQILAASAGVRTDVTPKEATLIHRLTDGRDVHVKLDLDRIERGDDPNIMLASGDILWVPWTVETRVQDWANRNLFFRAGFSATAGANYQATGIEYLNENARRSSVGNAANLQDTFDPLGFLTRNALLQTINSNRGQTANP
jgi:protein involved in polysaccharide export with SLBB domain